MPGNASLLGSYWYQRRFLDPPRPAPPGNRTTRSSSWTHRANGAWTIPNINFNDTIDFSLLLRGQQRTAERIYAHPTYNITATDSYKTVERVLRWVCNAKTDGTPENWKATDGEAASYIYSRYSTSVKKNSYRCPVRHHRCSIVDRKDPRGRRILADPGDRLDHRPQHLQRQGGQGHRQRQDLIPPPTARWPT